MRPLIYLSFIIFIHLFYLYRTVEFIKLSILKAHDLID